MNNPVPVSFHEWDDTPHARRRLAMLADAEIQVWLAELPPDSVDLTGLNCLLSPDERDRAERYRVREPQRQFVFGRALLRQLLGACLHVEPTALTFEFQPRGKPFLVQPPLGGNLHFNLSHSGTMVAIALARRRAVGVDIELMRKAEDWLLLSERVFSPREWQELQSLPKSQQTQAFFNGWTRKEAYLKAVGEGLTDTLAAIEVTLAPGKKPELLALPSGAKTLATWSIHPVPLPPNYAGAVVFQNV